MRKTQIVFVVASAAALVAFGAPTSIAAGQSGNAGHQAKLHPGTDIAPAKGSAITRAFHRFGEPSTRYLSNSCVIDLSGITDFTPLSSVTGCGVTVTLSGTWEKRSVPGSWGTWNCPPATESCTPNILYSSGQTSATISFGHNVRRAGGFELEPNLFQVETMQVDYYARPNGHGQLRGTMTRRVNGDNGARLFGVHIPGGYRSAVITDLAGDDFAIAQVRV